MPQGKKRYAKFAFSRKKTFFYRNRESYIMKNNFTALLCLAICFLSIPRLYAGTSKDAADFGFLPENDAETNAIALQSALEGGGVI